MLKHCKNVLKMMGCIGGVFGAAYSALPVEKYSNIWTSAPTLMPSNKAMDAPFIANGDMAVSVGGTPAATRFYFAKSDFWKFKSREEGGVGPQVLGGIDIAAPSLVGGSFSAKVPYYVPELNLHYAQGVSALNMHAWIADDENLFVCELTGGTVAVDVVIKYWIASGNGSLDSTGKDTDINWMSRSFVPASSGVDFASGVSFAAKKFGGGSDTLTLQPGQKITFVATMHSSFEIPAYKTASVNRVRTLAITDLAASYQKHQTWWQNYWNLSMVSLGDTVLEKNYYVGLYALGSGSRNPSFPPGLFGLWVSSNTPNWKGDYHLNYNYQAAFYGLYSANRLQTAATYEAPLLDFMDRGKYYATSILHIRGIYYPVGIGPKGVETSRHSSYCNPQALEGNFAGQKSDANYGAVNMVQRYYSTMDTAYARKVYPYFIELANFWEDYLKFENGRYVIYEDAIHECTYGDFNPILELAFVKMVFKTILDMSQDLNVDASRKAKWQDILAKISAFPTQQMSGKTVFRYAETGTAWWPDNTLGIQHIYPAGAIGLGSDTAQLSLAQSTMQVMNRFKDGNGMNSFFPAAARTGSFPPDTILAQLKLLAANCYPNLVPKGQPHGMENYSIFHATLDEMLMQSHQGLIRIFPMWPMNKDAQFSTLRAYGAFLVSSSLVGGTVQSVTLKSEKGKSASVLNPWKGSRVTLYRNGRKDSTLAADTVRFATSPGEVVLLVKEGTVSISDMGKNDFSKSMRIALHAHEIRVTGNSFQPLSVSVFDVHGKLVTAIQQGQQASGNPVVIQINPSSHGLYLVQVINGRNRIAEKIMLQ